MPELQPRIDAERVTQLLERELGATIAELTPLTGGNVASTFAFVADSDAFIVRFNGPMAVTFEKEAFIARTYASPAVPIPDIVALGREGELDYAVSRRASGVPISELPPEAIRAILPRLFATLDAIHAADTTATTGFGIIGNDGNGLSRSWREHLLAVREAGSGYFAGWERLFETGFLDRAQFNRTFAVLERHLPFCPEERALLHGDFGFGNLLVADGRVSAVIDWISAAYGDRLYDLAWLSFWGATPDFDARIRRHYAETGQTFDHYDERMRCYLAFIGLNASRFYAVGGDEPAYRWVQDRLEALGLFDDRFAPGWPGGVS